MSTNNTVARFEYRGVGCDLFINDEFVCSCGVFEHKDKDRIIYYDVEKELKFLEDKGVTHIIDIEVFEDQEDAYPDMPYPLHTLEEWCDAQGYY